MIILDSISKVFNEGKPNEKVALQDVNLEIQDGEMVAIIGKSGAGKSTLMNVIACLDTATRGALCIDGEDVTKCPISRLSELRNKKIGVVTQSAFLIDSLKPIENVVIPLMYSKGDKKVKYLRAKQTLESVGIDAQLSVPTAVLSGGEQQRVSIARAIVNQPEIVLADEPTGNLDTENTKTIMDILSKINAEGKTVIIITHDIDVANQCKRVITISDGTIVSDTSKTN